jgi:DNA-binding MarR family transcriptional regulator
MSVQMKSALASHMSELELAAWRGLFRVHAAFVRDLDRELEETHGLPLTQFEVLIHLDKAPDKRLRMSELASMVLLSQSGVTRLVDRLEAQGLVVREPCPSDRRGLHARLTDEGSRRLAEALPTHIDGIRARFLSRLEQDDLRSLTATWERIMPGITA